MLLVTLLSAEVPSKLKRTLPSASTLLDSAAPVYPNMLPDPGGTNGIHASLAVPRCKYATPEPEVRSLNIVVASSGRNLADTNLCSENVSRGVGIAPLKENNVRPSASTEVASAAPMIL